MHAASDAETGGAPIRLAIIGSRGRMGTRLIELARRDRRFTLAREIDRQDVPRDDDSTAEPAGATPGERGIDAVIDFSSDEGAAMAADLAQRHHAALLVGTTGLSPRTIQLIQQAARGIPVLVAPNTALGVAVLNHLAAEAARLLGPSFEIQIIETHHAAKRDAPSGTAIRLVQALQEKAGRKLPPEQVRSVRTGEVIGEHVLQLTGPGEQLTITHAATSRDLFALGALRAAAWLRDQPPGRYSIEQALGIGGGTTTRRPETR